MTDEPDVMGGLAGIIAATAGTVGFTVWTCADCGKDLDSHCGFCGRSRPGRPCAPGAPECECASLTPIDLLAPPKLILSTDPDSLLWWGPLNLVAFGREGSRGNECSLHRLTIGEHGCPRCREIHEHRKTLRDA